MSRLTCLLSPADKLAEQLNEDDEDEDDEEEVLDLTLGDDGEPSDLHPPPPMTHLDLCAVIEYIQRQPLDQAEQTTASSTTSLWRGTDPVDDHGRVPLASVLLAMKRVLGRNPSPVEARRAVMAFGSSLSEEDIRLCLHGW